ncbi:MAG: hypothetical protein Kow0099_27470 [Candidatus Abyssubacteria bacterium]
MRPQSRVPIVCISASLLLIVFHAVAQPEFFDAHLARRFTLSPINDLYRCIYHFGATFVLLGLLPAIFACALWNERPSEWGLTLGRNKLGGAAVLLGLFVVMLPVLAHMSKLPEVSATHPLCRLAVRHTGALVIYEASLLFHMAGWEFFFRGFLLFGLKKPLGESAIYLQALPYALMYLDGSHLEALGAIPAGIILGYLASRTGSVWYSVLLHWLCVSALDYMVIMRPF